MCNLRIEKFMDVIEYIVTDIFEGKYNNVYDLENKFYDDIKLRLRNESEKNIFF